jgi:hypothetical protein
MTSVWAPGAGGFVARAGDRVVCNLAARRAEPARDPAAALRDHATSVGWVLPDRLRASDDAPFFDRIREVRCPT